MRFIPAVLPACDQHKLYIGFVLIPRDILEGETFVDGKAPLLHASYYCRVEKEH
jgi:hypothetical protein